MLAVIGFACIVVTMIVLSNGYKGYQFRGVVTPDQMVGVWMLTHESQQKLINFANFKTYTNRTDHVLVLNKDGTAVYRAMNNYSGYFGYITEAEDYLNFTGYSGSVPEKFRDKDAKHKTWYVWDVSAKNPLTGPYPQYPDGAGGVVMTNKWACWSLSEDESGSDDKYRDGYEGRTRLVFHHVDSTAGGQTWFVGSRDGRLFLWTWIRAPSLDKVVEFEKSDMATVGRMASEETGRINIP